MHNVIYLGLQRQIATVKAHEETEQMMREKFRQEHNTELSVEGYNPLLEVSGGEMRDISSQRYCDIKYN